MKKIRSLDIPISETGSKTFWDNIEWTTIEDTLKKMLQESRSDEIADVLNTLKKKNSKEVLTLYYGIWKETCYSLADIAAEMNLTSERVRQIKDKALISLRKVLNKRRDMGS